MATIEPGLPVARIPRPENPYVLNPVVRWTPAVLGSVLALYGAKRRDFGGAALAVASGALIYQSLYRSKTRPLQVRESYTIGRPREELFYFWRNLENLPRFMKHLAAVEVVNDRYSHWIAAGPAGRRIEWDAEITREIPNELIAWRSRENSDVPNAGFVRFADAPAGRGTELYVMLEYAPPAGRLAAAVAKLFGEEPEIQIREDLRRFKRLIETGEIPTTAGQPHGRRGRIRDLEKNARRVRNIVESARTLAFGGVS